MKAEFDSYAENYKALLDDPMRNMFAPGGGAYFHRRKHEVIQAYLRSRGLTSSAMQWLDVGCGLGELLQISAPSFKSAVGCDPSAGMLQAGINCEVVLQPDPLKLPFPDASFDFVTAVCVYHHVPVADRAELTADIRRVLRPGGTFCMIEHNPWNPVTRLIVSRTPVDENAILLSGGTAAQVVRAGGLAPDACSYFLYFPEKLQRLSMLEAGLLSRVPGGGQYALFSRRA